MRSRDRQSSVDGSRDFIRSLQISEHSSPSERTGATGASQQATISLSALVRARGSKLRAVEERQPRPLTRHYLFDGQGRSEVALSYFDLGAGEPETEEANVA